MLDTKHFIAKIVGFIGRDIFELLDLVYLALSPALEAHNTRTIQKFFAFYFGIVSCKSHCVPQ
jgi:hypothetical protein